jgi:hypothetical protein
MRNSGPAANAGPLQILGRKKSFAWGGPSTLA